MGMRTTSETIWRSSLVETLAQLRLRRPQSSPAARVALVGIGQELRGDDAAGMIIARALSRVDGNGEGSRIPADDHERLPLRVIEGGAAPENCTGILRRFQPDLVIFVDAAQMDQEPGTVRWLECKEIAGFSASTHTLPLDMLAHYLEAELGCQVALLGIQPAGTSFDATLSPAAARAVTEIVETFHNADVFEPV